MGLISFVSNKRKFLPQQRPLSAPLFSTHSRLISAVDGHFSSDINGLSLEDLMRRGKSAGVNDNPCKHETSHTSSSITTDSKDVSSSEQAVIDAIHESESNLLKMKLENPEEFEFMNGDVLPSRDTPNKHVVERNGKSNTPKTLGNLNTENSEESPDDRPLAWDIDTSMFDKSRKMKNRLPVLQSRLPTLSKKSQISQDKSIGWKKSEDILNNVDRQVVPKNTAEPHVMGAERKVLDIQRWYCISRPQYKTTCGLSSVVSCWNFLYSTLGRGSNKPITQEEALTILGFKPDFSDTKFGPFTSNRALMRWFQNINEFYGVNGRAYILYKPNGSCKTLGVTPEKVLSRLKEGLRRADHAFIYHCYNHYFCPIGYEETPNDPTKAYCTENMRADEKENWILIGDTSRNHSCIHCIKWNDIAYDLNLGNPEYTDIRRPWKGVMKRNKSNGGNLHCILAFEKSVAVNTGRNRLPSYSDVDSSDEIEDLEDE